MERPSPPRWLSNRRILLRQAIAVACLVFADSCDPGDPETVPQPPPAAIPKAEPLETVSLEQDEIVTLEETSRKESPVGIVCPWASIWQDPSRGRPVPLGGSIKPPRKIADVPPSLPPWKAPKQGTPVLEVIVDTDGYVSEATVLQSFDPPWPEGDEAMLAAVKQWRYEPTFLEGKTVPICMKITLHIEWD